MLAVREHVLGRRGRQIEEAEETAMKKTPHVRKPEFLALPPVPDTTITRADVVFPASVRHLMPRPEDIPSNYDRRGEWRKFQAKWFYEGLDAKKIKEKSGFDLTQVLAHLSCIQGSYEPKHQHKVDAVAWLASQWLDESSLDGIAQSERSR